MMRIAVHLKVVLGMPLKPELDVANFGLRPIVLRSRIGRIKEPYF